MFARPRVPRILTYPAAPERNVSGTGKPPAVTRLTPQGDGVAR